MYRHELCPTEIQAIRSQIGDITASHSSAERNDFLNCASAYAQDLPKQLQLFLNHFKQAEPKYHLRSEEITRYARIQQFAHHILIEKIVSDAEHPLAASAASPDPASQIRSRQQ